MEDIAETREHARLNYKESVTIYKGSDAQMFRVGLLGTISGADVHVIVDGNGAGNLSENATTKFVKGHEIILKNMARQSQAVTFYPA